MTTPGRRHIPALRLGLAVLAALLASACDQGPDDHDSEARLAVVLIAEDGLEQSIGSYDIETGALTFAPQVQDDMREVFGDAGHRAIVAHEGDDADVDLDAGVALTAAELDDGDVLELRVARRGARTITLGRLELRVVTEELAPTWRAANITGMDDWEKHNV
jgi:hypothetical protein